MNYVAAVLATLAGLFAAAAAWLALGGELARRRSGRDISRYAELLGRLNSLGIFELPITTLRWISVGYEAALLASHRVAVQLLVGKGRYLAIPYALFALVIHWNARHSDFLISLLCALLVVLPVDRFRFARPISVFACFLSIAVSSWGVFLACATRGAWTAGLTTCLLLGVPSVWLMLTGVPLVARGIEGRGGYDTPSWLNFSVGVVFAAACVGTYAAGSLGPVERFVPGYGNFIVRLIDESQPHRPPLGRDALRGGQFLLVLVLGVASTIQTSRAILGAALRRRSSLGACILLLLNMALSLIIGIVATTFAAWGSPSQVTPGQLYRLLWVIDTPNSAFLFWMTFAPSMPSLIYAAIVITATLARIVLVPTQIVLQESTLASNPRRYLAAVAAFSAVAFGEVARLAGAP